MGSKRELGFGEFPTHPPSSLDIPQRHRDSPPVLKFRWSLAPPQPLLIAALCRDTGVSPLLAQCLINRGHSVPAGCSRFLDPKLRHLADPFLLPAMDRAIERLFRAREQSERVVIFGDYDVDGVTSSALLATVLRHFGWQIDLYLPHRMDEGYGLSLEAAANCLKKFPATLLLAVDCGSTAVATIQWLRERAVDVIVLDHHQVSSPAPDAVALVNPQLTPSAPGTDPHAKPFTELCSAGLAFKLAHALLKRARETNLPGAADFDLRPLLDLVALGTIADLVPLTGENRILVTAGLDRLRDTARPGLIALKEVAQVGDEVGAYEVGFQLGPRLNAAGRLETATESLDLLLATDAVTASQLAQNLDARNRERQQVERGILDEVTGAVRARFDPARDFAIVEGQLLWHIGVVGIVAARVLQQFYRPTIILGGDGHEWRGSGRSIAGFDLAHALRGCDDLLLRHGGHAMAAGVTIRPDMVDAFRERLNDLARRTLAPADLQPSLRLDASVPLRELTENQINELDRLAPLGQSNPAVQLIVPQLRSRRPPFRMGREQQHAKFSVTDNTGATADAVWWNAPKEDLPSGPFDLACAPQINDYNGRRTIQLKVLDWRHCE
jgi:single-stranded-DNA-specific exonuclease